MFTVKILKEEFIHQGYGMFDCKYKTLIDLCLSSKIVMRKLLRKKTEDCLCHLTKQYFRGFLRMNEQWSNVAYKQK